MNPFKADEMLAAHRRSIRETTKKNPRYHYPPPDIGYFGRYERHSQPVKFDSGKNPKFDPSYIQDPGAIVRFVEQYPEGTISVSGHETNGRFSIRGSYSAAGDTIAISGTKNMTRGHTLASRNYDERMPLGAFYDTVNAAHLLYTSGRVILTALEKHIHIYEEDPV